MTLVSKTINGIAILATCRQINIEASAFFEPKFRTMKENIRIIANTVALRSERLKGVLMCVSMPEKMCRGSADPRKLLTYSKYHNHIGEDITPQYN